MTRPLEASLPTTPDLGTSEKFELKFNLQISKYSSKDYQGTILKGTSGREKSLAQMKEREK